MKKLLLSLLVMSISLFIFAQTNTTTTTSSSISAYSYEGERSGVDKLKMNVYILGQVHKPGLYLVPDDTDFLTLLALAGGPTEDAKLSKIRIIRPEKEALDRTSEPEIIWINFAKYMETADHQYLATNTEVTNELDEETGLIQEKTVYDLRLQPGDTIVVSGTIFYALTKVASIISDATIFLSVYSLINSLN